MHYLAKAFTQKLLSYLPYGEAVNYALQRKVTRSLPRSHADFLCRIDSAAYHLRNFLAEPAADLRQAHFYEFGAGWDLIIPLTYAFCGVGQQTVIDIQPLVRLDIINDTIVRLNAHAEEVRRHLGLPFQPRPLVLSHIAELAQLGIRWTAPLDARATGLPPASVDFISNTSTLEHIPAGDLLPILTECARLLKPGGLMSCIIDCSDHFSYCDARIGAYHFLKHSDIAWAWINSPLQYQNRLRYPDYMDMIARTPMAVVAQELRRPKSVDDLRLLPLAPKYRQYALDDLAVSGMQILLRRG